MADPVEAEMSTSGCNLLFTVIKIGSDEAFLGNTQDAAEPEIAISRLPNHCSLMTE